MIKVKDINLFFSLILFVSGVYLLIIPQTNITGAFLGVPELVTNFFRPILGIVSIALSIVLFTTTGSGLEKNYSF